MDSNVSRLALPLATGIGGYLLKHITDRFFSRVRILNYTVGSVFIGSSAEDSLFGSVEIRHNGNKVNSLYLTTLELTNGSSKDFSDLSIVLYADTNSLILFSHSEKLGEVSGISFQKSFLDAVNSGKFPELHFRRRDYHLPVLNRGETLKFQLLITNLKSETPSAWMSCEHPGLKLNIEKINDRFWGEPRKTSALIGMAISLIIASASAYIASNSSPKTSLELSLLVLVPTMFGIYCIIPGVAVMRAIRVIKRLF